VFTFGLGVLDAVSSQKYFPDDLPILSAISQQPLCHLSLARLDEPHEFWPKWVIALGTERGRRVIDVLANGPDSMFVFKAPSSQQLPFHGLIPVIDLDHLLSGLEAENLWATQPNCHLSLSSHAAHTQNAA
jgi:hypothetical protein